MNRVCYLTRTSTTFQSCVASGFFVSCDGAVSGAIAVKLLIAVFDENDSSLDIPLNDDKGMVEKVGTMAAAHLQFWNQQISQVSVGVSGGQVTTPIFAV